MAQSISKRITCTYTKSLTFSFTYFLKWGLNKFTSIACGTKNILQASKNKEVDRWLLGLLSLNIVLKFTCSEKANKFCKIHCRFDQYKIGQIYGGDFAKFCGPFRIYEL